LLEKEAGVPDLVRLGFLLRVRPVEAGDHAVQLEAHTGTVVFDG
jgi:hypothetical protein